MKKNKKNRQKNTSPKTNIIDLKNDRDGGQIALRGYSYQFLYSCYLILSSGRDAQFQLEGIEDVDCIKQKDGNSSVTHIQLKYSVNKQDASFLPDVLKNFLETYLLDQNRFFKLVYDFPVAKGHLSKLFDSNLDDKSRAYWTDVISKIRQNNSYWNWAAYDFNTFISRLSFEKIEKSTLAAEIEKAFNLYKINDIASYASIAEWIYNIDSDFNLSINIPLEYIWLEPENLSLDCISTLMYVSYCGNKDVYSKFVERKLKHILTYLKQQTKSQKIWIDFEKNAVHVEYILRLRDMRAGNEHSVSRLKYVCKMLPIFDVYCADALKPTLNLLSVYTVPDDAHKEMPIRNIVIMFHQNLTSLWNKTIMSNYEFDTVTEWVNHWFDVRECICLLANKCCACIYKLLGGKPLGGLTRDVDQLREEFALITTGEKLYPKEDRPFEEKASIPQGLREVKSKYFQSAQNFINQFAGFLRRDNQKQRLAMINLTAVQSAVSTMQNYFEKIAIDLGFEEKHLKLCNTEVLNIEQLKSSINIFICLHI